MKKLIVIISFLLIGITYGQTETKIKTVYESVPFYADSVSQVLSLNSGLYLQGLLIPEGLSITFNFKVSKDGSTFYDLSDTSAVIQYSVDSTKNIGLALPGDLFKAWKYYKFVTDNDKADTNNVIAVESNK